MAEIRQKYIDTYGGVKNASKPIVKSGKINFETIDTGTSNNQTNQLTESKEYQTKVISLMFGIPPQMLIGGAMDLETTTTLYLSNAIEPIVKAFEESFQKLFNISDKERFYIEFNRNSVMRTSLLQKIDSYTKQINYGLLTPNEVRAKENLSSIEAGDCSFIPANLMPLTKENIHLRHEELSLLQNEKILKGLRPKHITVFAKNAQGLKDLLVMRFLWLIMRYLMLGS